MKTLSYSAARASFASLIDEVCEDRAPVIVTKGRAQAVVVMSLADFHGLQETTYLLRSPANAKRLMAAKSSVEKGQGRRRQLAKLV